MSGVRSDDVRSALEELAAEDYQRRVWTGRAGGDEMSEFVECVARLDFALERGDCPTVVVAHVPVSRPWRLRRPGPVATSSPERLIPTPVAAQTCSFSVLTQPAHRRADQARAEAINDLDSAGTRCTSFPMTEARSH